MKVLLVGHSNRVAKPSELLAAYIKYEQELFHVVYTPTGFGYQAEVFFKFYNKKYIQVLKKDINIEDYEVIICCYDGSTDFVRKIIIKALKLNKKVINLLCSGIKLSEESRLWVPFVNPAGEIKFGRSTKKEAQNVSITEPR